MVGETTITIVGNLTADPELRYTNSGLAVVNFTVASTSRMFDKNTNDWRQGDTLFLRGSCWREFAENVAESLSKGMRVLLSGRLRQRNFEGKDGSQRSVFEVDVDEIGPSLRFYTASIRRKQPVSDYEVSTNENVWTRSTEEGHSKPSTDWAEDKGHESEETPF